MYRFWESVLRPICDIVRPHVIVEIGCADGRHTRLLLDYCRQTGGFLHAIDPCPSFREEDFGNGGDHLLLHRAPSLNVLPGLKDMDLVLIDGDHNWYTVYHELLLIAERSRNGHPFPVVVLHDMDWPYGRRDRYDDPQRIPAEFRQPCGTGGIEPGLSELCTMRGFNQTVTHAAHEGGPRNGVLTAIEDFLAHEKTPLSFQRIGGFHGLGILIPQALLKNPDLGMLLASFDHAALHPHIERLEGERIGYELWARSELQTATTARRDMTRHTVESIAEISRLEENIHDLCEDLHQTMARVSSLEQILAEEREKRTRIEHSRSWQWTTPLRRLEGALRARFGKRQDPSPLPPSNPSPNKTGPRVLVIDRYPAVPHRHSGGLRMFRLLLILEGLDCRVRFAVYGNNIATEDAARLRRRGIDVLESIAEEGQRAFWEGQRGNNDIVILSRLPVAEAHYRHIRETDPAVKIVFDTVDLHFLRQRREGMMLQNDEILREADAAECAERQMAMKADVTVVVSGLEKTILSADRPDASIFEISNIHRIFPPRTAFPDRNGIIFIGNFQHRPNIDAVRFFVDSILPLLLPHLPYLHLTVIGENPPMELTALQNPHISCVGAVRDLGAFFESSILSIAPLRYGAGVKGKINTSMSFGVPVVATPLAAEGMHLTHGADVLIARTPEQFAKCIIDLHRDRALWERISRNGIATTNTHYSLATAAQQTTELLHGLGWTPKATSAFEIPSILAVIPTAGRDLVQLQRCIRTLRNASNGTNLRIVVVLCPADSSIEGSPVWRELNVELRALPGPFGFSRSINEGLRQQCDEDFVLLLNDDCFFVGTDSLLSMITTLRQQECAAIGPWVHQIRDDGVTLGPPRGSGFVELTQPLPGMCMLWNTAWTRHIGPFDEHFNNGYGSEEADFCLRARQLGARWGRDDRITVLHENHATFGMETARFSSEAHQRNQHVWSKKYPGVDSWGKSEHWQPSARTQRVTRSSTAETA